MVGPKGPPKKMLSHTRHYGTVQYLQNKDKKLSIGAGAGAGTDGEEQLRFRAWICECLKMQF